MFQPAFFALLLSLRMVSGLSLKLMASTAIFSLPRYRCSFSRFGSSARQGAHHVAQNVTTAIFPCCALRRTFSPVT